MNTEYIVGRRERERETGKGEREIPTGKKRSFGGGRRTMAGAAFGDGGDGKRAHLYEYRITGYFIFACVVAALGGSLFGYDLGVSGEFFLSFLCFRYRV